MSQTATRYPSHSWNMALPLRVLIIEDAMDDAELSP